MYFYGVRIFVCTFFRGYTQKCQNGLENWFLPQILLKMHISRFVSTFFNGVSEKITSSISTSLDVRPDVQIFKRPKNREDGSNFDDFRPKFSKERNNDCLTIEKILKNFENSLKKIRKSILQSRAMSLYSLPLNKILPA